MREQYPVPARAMLSVDLHHPRTKPVSDPQMPSFIRQQAEKARARAQAAQQALQPPTNRNLDPLDVQQHTQQTQASPELPAQALKEAKKATKPPKQTKANTKGKAPPDRSLDGANLSSSVTRLLDPIEALEFWRTHSTNTPAFDLFAPHLPAMMTTIISGSLIRGPAGYQDRMTVMRMLGAPFTPSSSQRGEAAQQVEALSERFLRAVTRVERKLVGHKSVTVDAEYTLEPAPQAEKAA